jgi:hypothetical protein
MATLEIGARSRDGFYEITDTNSEGNGTLRVTVRELYGVSMAGPAMLQAMRRLARRAVANPASAAEVNRFYSGGCSHVTFAVTAREAATD